MNPTNSDIYAHDRIAELMRVSSDIHRGPEGGGIASHVSAALSAPSRWLTARRAAAAAAAAAVVRKRFAERP